MKTWLIIVLVIIAIPILVLGYLGFVPFVSDIMGSNKPRDLGVRYTEADLKSVMAKNGIQEIVLPDTNTPDGSVVYSGSKPLKNSFTQEELTARMADYEKEKYNPLSEPQLRINEDGTAEISGRVDLRMIDEGADAFNVPQNIVDGSMPYIDKLKVVNPNPAFYAKGKLEIINNQIDVDLQEVEIGRTGVPLEKIPLAKNEMEVYMEQILDVVPGLDIKSLKFEDGEMDFDGTIPSKVSMALKEYE